MADFDPTDPIVRYTENDIGPSAGDGKDVTEQSFAEIISEIVQNFVDNGLTLPATSASLSIDLAAGVCYVSGYRVEIPNAVSLTVGASVTSYVFLRLDRDGDNNVEAVKIEVNTTGSQPADSIWLATIVSGGTTITSTRDRAQRGKYGDFEVLFHAGL